MQKSHLQKLSTAIRFFLALHTLCLLFVQNLFAQFTPNIATVTPMAAAPGTTVTIMGSGFSGAINTTSVFFNGASATLTQVTPSRIDAIVPTGARSGFITVINRASNTLRQVITPQFFNVIYNGGSFTNSSLAAPVSISAGTNSAPRFLDLADFDGDGKLDILAARNAMPLGIFRNTTSNVNSPTFATPVTLSTDANTETFVVHDFNNDGKLDIFQTLNGGVQGKAIGNTSTPGSISGGMSIVAGGVANANMPMRGTAVGDMGSARDGRADVLWMMEANQSVTTSIVYTNGNTSAPNSPGIVSFSSNSPLMASANLKRCWDVKAADFDGDGLTDVATYETGTGNTNNLLINRNTSNGFASQASHTITLGVSSPQNGRMAVCDVDRDGKPDLILTVSNVSLRVFRNTSTPGNLSFSMVGNFAADLGNKTNFAVGDITGDGLPDLVISRNSNSGGVINVHGNLTILPNTSSGGTISFGTAILFNGPAASDVAIGDVTGDGYPDVVTISALGHTINIYRNTFGTVPPPAITSFTPSTGTQGTTVTIAGAQFTGATAVSFNNVAAQSFTVVSPTQITAVVPGPGTSGTIKVVTPGGTAESATNFSYLNKPNATSFTPRHAGSRGEITIMGSNFNNVTQIQIGGINAPFNLINNNTILAGVPTAGRSGSITLRVNNEPPTELPGFTFVNSRQEMEGCSSVVIFLTAPSGGIGYQWQVDSGQGFINLQNGSFATGTNTATLQIIGATTQHTGFQFRCLVNSVPQAPLTLRYVSHFTGSVNGDWLNAANWTCGLPDRYTDVMIIPNSVEITGTGNIMRRLHVTSGKTVNVANNASLTITQ